MASHVLDRVGEPAALASVDVCMVPVVHSAYTASMVPTKIGEYLAMGKPVVSTSIPYALELEHAVEGAVITADPRPADFLDALEAALVLAADEQTESRCRAVAAAAAWPRRIEEIATALTTSSAWQRGTQEGDQAAHVVGPGKKGTPAEPETAQLVRGK
jgi:glycosyltransferase involved in cell wall biosynthesis